jgi:hypothetical protein
MPTRVKLLEQAIADQRDLLRRYVNPVIEKVAQIFCPYKEALAQYRAGLKVPDDVTIVWTEDNYGYIRQLSTPEEQKRGGGAQWQVIPGLGRSGDSVAVYPVTTASIDRPGDILVQAPRLEYDMTTTSFGQVEVTTYCLPTRRIHEGRGLRYAVAIDDEQPRIVDLNEDTEGPRWSQNVPQNATINSTRHRIAAAGHHILKVWMVDPGVVMDKIVVNAGGVKDSYLGPPETLVTSPSSAGIKLD